MGPLQRLMMLLAREAPAQQKPAREALARAARTGKEHSVVGVAEGAPAGRIVMGDEYSVTPDAADLARATSSGRPALDFHTHPMRSNLFDVSPSQEDMSYYGFNYVDPRTFTSAQSELRALIAAPPGRGPNQRTAYHLFATDRPSEVFKSDVADAARYEQQRAASRGRFKSVVDDPLFRDYFDYGGNIGDILSDANTLALLRRRAEQGMGRQELQLSGAPVGRTGTNVELLRRLQPTMLEVLREKKLARGGLAQVKECSCNG